MPNLCAALQGLPLCLEHGDGLDGGDATQTNNTCFNIALGRPNLAIGSVLKAWQSEDGSVRVMCSIDASTELGDHVRANVLNRQLPDLSLSHSYEMFLDGSNKVALVKSPIEVSVCSMGAREGVCKKAVIPGNMTLRSGTHILDRAILACSRRNRTDSDTYITKSQKIRYVGVLRASMAEAEVAMTDAPETAAPVESVPAPETTSAAAPQAAATAPAPATTEAAAPAPVPAAPQAVVEKAAAPAADADTLLSMDRQQLAEFTAKVTSEASSKVDEMTKQMNAQQEELAMLRAEHEKRIAEEKNQQLQAFNSKLEELKAEGFNQDGLLMGIESMVCFMGCNPPGLTRFCAGKNRYEQRNDDAVQYSGGVEG